MNDYIYIATVLVGVSKRRWHIEIIQDHLEETEETFEVLLVSPEGTVIGRINKAQLTIRDSEAGKNLFFPHNDFILGLPNILP